MSSRVIRQFGDWELVLIDLASCEKIYVNVVTKETSEDPPPEVLDMLERENRQRRKPVYEPTSFRFAPVCREQLNSDDCICCTGSGIVECIGQCPLCDGAGYLAIDDSHTSSASAIEHMPLPHPDGCSVLLRNLMSREECRDVVEQAERFGLRNCGYNPRIRITDRVSIMGEDLAAVLFERLRPYVSDVEITRCGTNKMPLGIRDDAKVGWWTPVGLNPCFRVCRYEPGGFFLPHHDGGFEYDADNISLKTVMVYLNDDFEGGQTNFYSQSQRHYSDPDSSKVIYELCPEVGSCVLFNHWLVHDGGELHSGVKYILRSELMYTWQGSAVRPA